MKKIKNKKILLIIVLLVVISTTIAFLYSTDTFQNIFVAASYKVTVTEEFVSPESWVPGDETDKTVTLKNEGTVPIKVRVKLEESWKDSNNQDLPLQHNDENVAIINFANQDDYIYKDGYYYYDLPLQPGETTSSIIESVTFNPNYSGTVTCIENDNTHSCSSSESGYEGGTYKLTLTIEGVQEDYYVQAWRLSGIVERQYLYNVLKKETENGGLARKYTGEHHDSFTEEPSKDIYHYYAKNDSEGNQVKNINNVIFGEHCWKMIRTTDTGGVKMIYNGVVEDNQCLKTRKGHVGYSWVQTNNLNNYYWYGTDYEYDDIDKLFKISGTTEQTIWNDSTYQELIGKYTCKSTNEDDTCSTLYLVESYYDTSKANTLSLIFNTYGYSHFGEIEFNHNSTSLSDVGYMYNTRYDSKTKGLSSIEYMLNKSSLSTSYWYADTISYNSTTKNYSLVEPYQISSNEDYSNLVGKYTFRNDTQTYSTSYVYYITEVENNDMYTIQLNNSANHNLSDYNYTYIYGDSFTDNGDGTYTINSPSTLDRTNWYSNYANIKNKYVCKNAINDTCSDLWYSQRTNSTSLVYNSLKKTYKYSKGFSYDNDRGVYTLINDSVTYFERTSTNINSTKGHRYTCWNESGECNTISYLIGTLSYDSISYIDMNDGKGIEDCINEMLYADNVNSINSTIKFGIEAWYKHFMLDYDNYIEDTIYCNNRTIDSLGAWDSTTENTNSEIIFKDYNNISDLSCLHNTDQFSISNNKAKLDYKVGLATFSEMKLLNNNNARKEYSWYYWILSPYRFNNGNVFARTIHENGSFNTGYLYANGGLRPVISLKPGIEYTDGDGSMEHPYIVKMD